MSMSFLLVLGYTDTRHRGPQQAELSLRDANGIHDVAFVNEKGNAQTWHGSWTFADGILTVNFHCRGGRWARTVFANNSPRSVSHPTVTVSNPRLFSFAPRDLNLTVEDDDAGEWIVVE